MRAPVAQSVRMKRRAKVHEGKVHAIRDLIGLDQRFKKYTRNFFAGIRLAPV
jgi:hypothetical protein